jgi:hypothetical protein
MCILLLLVRVCWLLVVMYCAACAIGGSIGALTAVISCFVKFTCICLVSICVVRSVVDFVACYMGK